MIVSVIASQISSSDLNTPSGTTMKSRMFGAPPKRLSIFSAQRVWMSQQA